MVEGLFEMIRSSEESKVQELLAMIRANASMSSIAAMVEANLKTSDGSQKRKKSVSSSALSQEDTGAAEHSGSDVDMGQTDPSPQPGLIGSEPDPSWSASRPAPHWVTSPSDSIEFTGPALESLGQSPPILDLAQVRTLAMVSRPSSFLVIESLMSFLEYC